jgi:hypothetical protein
MSEKDALKALSAIDGSVLAIIAQTPDISEEQLKSLLNRVSPDAQAIATKMVELRHQDEKAPKLSFMKEGLGTNTVLFKTGKARKRKALDAVTKDATIRTAQSILHWASLNTKTSSSF